MRVKRGFGFSLQTGTVIVLLFCAVGVITLITLDVSFALTSNGDKFWLTICRFPLYVTILMSTISGLIGVYKNKSSFILPFLVVSVIGLILLPLSLFLFSIGYHVIPGNFKLQEFSFFVNGIVAIFTFATVFVAGSYWTVVVYSYYKELKEDGL